jgi:hypothetical protein
MFDIAVKGCWGEGAARQLERPHLKFVAFRTANCGYTSNQPSCAVPYPAGRLTLESELS